MTDLIDIATARYYLALASGADAGGQAAEGIRVLTASFNAFVGYELASAAHADIVVSGTGTRLLLLPARNVTAVTKVEYRIPGETAWTEYDASDYEVDARTGAGVLAILISSWRVDYSYRATFTAGWAAADIPGDIIEMFIYELRRYVERRQDLASENMGGQSNSGQNYIDITAKTQRALSRYMLVGA